MPPPGCAKPDAFRCRTAVPVAELGVAMSTRRSIPAVIAAAFALFFLCLGNYLGVLPYADTDARFAALRAELNELRRRDPLVATGTSGRNPISADLNASREAIVDDVKRQLSAEMGLLPVN